MINQQRALETLERYKIDETQLQEWESALGLEVPRDPHGNKVYSPLHINLFKNIKKHLALGRSLREIKRMIVLPDQVELAIHQEKAYLQPDTIDVVAEQELAEKQLHEIQAEAKAPRIELLEEETLPQIELNPLPLEMSLDAEADQTNLLPFKSNGIWLEKSNTLPRRSNRSLKRFASQPVRISAASLLNQPSPNAGLLVLIDRLIEEKDQLQEKLTQLEKQKVHLNQVNEMFQSRVKEQSGEIEQLQQQLKSREHFKLIDDKSRLQKQLLEAEKLQLDTERRLNLLNSEIKQLKGTLSEAVSPKIFLGNWLEEAELREIVYDNFGINIETKRNRMFKITHPPDRFFGHTAIIDTVYDYQTNNLWKRTETLILNIIHENRLEGELIVEYNLDGTPVARAIYQLKCHRNGMKTD